MRTVEIPLTRGMVALVDEADLPLVGCLKWHVQPCDKRLGGFYAVNGRGGAKPTIAGRRYMHRMIAGATPGQLVDHINGNGLDNRRCNLRIATHSQNNINRRLGSSTGFRGVERTASGKYRAKLRADGKIYRTPPFASPHEAACAHDEMARRLQGEFAVLNFPDETEAA